MSKTHVNKSILCYMYAALVRKDLCTYCGSLGGTVDHIYPYYKGPPRHRLFGKGSWQNMTGACGTCNVRKGSKGLLQFLVSKQQGEQIRCLNK